MSSDWIKRLGLLAVVVAAVAAFYMALREKPVLIDAATVQQGPMRVTINQEGITRVRDVYTVSSPIAGQLDRMTLEEGDPVKANETVIASIHPMVSSFLDERTRAELVAAVEAARSAVSLAQVDYQKAQTALNLARSDLDRATRLSETDIISDRDFEKAQNEVAILQAQVNSARANIRLKKAQLASAEVRITQPDTLEKSDKSGCCLHLRAPVDGVILKVLTKSEQAVAQGTGIAEIGNPNELEIAVDLLSEDAVRITIGADVLITNWGGDHDLEATVRRIDPAAFTKVSALGIEEQRVNAVLDLKQPQPQLGHEFRIFARLVVWEADNVLTVPIGALFRSGRDWSVFRLDGDRISLARLKIGHMNSHSAEIIEGLKTGEKVVLYPNDVLEDGTLVAER